MVPGVRPAGADRQDQARVVTPGQAITAGADWLVVGRAVTAADDPVAAAVTITAEVTAALGGELLTSPDESRFRPGWTAGPCVILTRPVRRPLEVAADAAPPRADARATPSRPREGRGRASRSAPRSRSELKAGVLSLEQLFEEGDEDDTLAKLKVVSVLESMPGVGKVRARRLMEELDISESRRLRGLGDNQRKKLLQRFA